jgi:hypothetical protein
MAIGLMWFIAEAELTALVEKVQSASICGPQWLDYSPATMTRQEMECWAVTASR